MAQKKSTKKTGTTKKSPEQINTFLWAVVIFIIGLAMTLLVHSKFRSDETRKTADSKVTAPSNLPIVHDFGIFEATLPPLGEKCEGCMDAAPGFSNGYKADVIESAQMLQGGNFTDEDAKKNGKWNLIEYTVTGEYPVIAANQTNGDVLFPGGDFFKQVSTMKVGTKRVFSRTSQMDGKVRMTYTRTADVLSSGKRIMTFDVTPVYQGGFIGRRDAIFTHKGKTVVIVFDWRDEQYAESLDAILKTIVQK